MRSRVILAVVAIAAFAMLAAAQRSFPVLTKATVKQIAGRTAVNDEQGKLLPWPMPDNIGYSYSSHVLTQWGILFDQYNRQRYYDFHCCFDFDRTTFEMQPDFHWANSTGYLRAMMEGFIEKLYAYTGDENALTFLAELVDYELDNGLTPDDYAWAGVPYASANPGARRYTGWRAHGEDYIEPHVVGEDGYGYLRFYEITGNTRYLRAAVKCADALVKNYKPGDEANSPWPVRCYARDGKVRIPGMGPYSANVVEPAMLFDELIRLGIGDVDGYRKTRQGAWDWLHKYPMKNNVWVGYFEDVNPSMDNMNNVIPLEYARYVLLHPELDPDWKENARRLIDWVKTTPKWPKYEINGALVTTEQGNGKTFCCQSVNECCDSHTARLGGVEALFYAKTGEAPYKEAAFRTLNWVTYWQGMPENAHTPFGNQWWFTDEFSDGPRRLMDGLAAVPEWAPADESHLVGSSSVVSKIVYARGAVTYSTFDEAATEVLRLNFSPKWVTAGGHDVPRARQLVTGGEAYTFDETTHVLRIQHKSRAIDVRGDSIPGENAEFVSRNVDFDNPHLGARVSLRGEYPSGIIHWGEGAWRTVTPGGLLATFGIATADPAATSASFRFSYPRVFTRVDVYNPAAHEISLTISAPEIQKMVYRLRPETLTRLKTAWADPASEIRLESAELGLLRFDNVGYSMESRTEVH